MIIKVKEKIKIEENIQLYNLLFLMFVNSYIIIYAIKGFLGIASLFYNGNIISISGFSLLLYFLLVILSGLFLMFKENNYYLMFFYMVFIQFGF
ncbi:MAG: hypothetical protein ACRC5R_02515 [Mycoplasmatales bacterium]